MGNQDTILALERITKAFMGVVANDDVSLTIRKGEIHALLGENGAGKSTLMNILVGLYTPDKGTIRVRGDEVHIKSPKQSIRLGIGMVHQHYKLVETLTVAENIVMGWPEQRWLINKSALHGHLMKLSETYNLPIRPGALVGDLSAGEKQRVEIVKMLYRRVEILILDEPTSVLTPQESRRLFENLEEMRKRGKTVIFISHKLDEIMAIADRVSVLRQGRLIHTVDTRDTTAGELARLMIGKDMAALEKKPAAFSIDDVPVLVAENLTARGDHGAMVLNGVSLEIRAGEILGIAGVSGNGQSMLAEVLTGLSPMEGGSIRFMGRDLTGKNPIDFINAGISHIPEDRIGVGSIPTFTCIENVILKSYKTPPIKRGLSLDYRKARQLGMDLMARYDVRIPAPEAPVKLLSGGNMQKLILAREISCDPKLIIAVHPTYGLDVSAVERVHSFLLKEQDKGSAVLLISEDLDEILTLSDTISVMYKGMLTLKQHRDECSVELIGQAMMGVTTDTMEAACS